jgi:DNA-directed RNA polymerase specialized sigma24 family protein
MTGRQTQTKYTAIDTDSFSSKESNRIGDAFVRWRIERDIQMQRVVDRWTHAFVVRFFVVHCARDRRLGPVVCDELIGKALERILGKRCTVQQPERYAGWVFALCRNLLVDAKRRRRIDVETLTAEPGADPTWAADGPGTETLAALHAAALSCMDRLPDYLKAVAHLRLVDGLPYRRIHHLTGTPVPTLRAYVQRIIRMLRAQMTDRWDGSWRR